MIHCLTPFVDRVTCCRSARWPTRATPHLAGILQVVRGGVEQATHRRRLSAPSLPVDLHELGRLARQAQSKPRPPDIYLGHVQGQTVYRMRSAGPRAAGREGKRPRRGDSFRQAARSSFLSWSSRTDYSVQEWGQTMRSGIWPGYALLSRHASVGLPEACKEEAWRSGNDLRRCSNLESHIARPAKLFGRKRDPSVGETGSNALSDLRLDWHI